jgi:preprotein translocase subunit Sec61beta
MVILIIESKRNDFLKHKNLINFIIDFSIIAAIGLIMVSRKNEIQVYTPKIVLACVIVIIILVIIRILIYLKNKHRM